MTTVTKTLNSTALVALISLSTEMVTATTVAYSTLLVVSNATFTTTQFSSLPPDTIVSTQPAETSVLTTDIDITIAEISTNYNTIYLTSTEQYNIVCVSRL